MKKRSRSWLVIVFNPCDEDFINLENKYSYTIAEIKKTRLEIFIHHNNQINMSVIRKMYPNSDIYNIKTHVKQLINSMKNLDNFVEFGYKPQQGKKNPYKRQMELLSYFQKTSKQLEQINNTLKEMAKTIN